MVGQRFCISDMLPVDADVIDLQISQKQGSNLLSVNFGMAAHIYILQ